MRLRESLTSRGLAVEAVSLRDLDLAGRHHPHDLLHRDREDGGEAFRDLLAVLLSGEKVDIPAGPRRDRGNRPAHDLAVAVDLHLADRAPHRQVMKLVPPPSADS